MKVTEYTFEDTEKLADEVLPTVTAKVVCSTCGKELSVPATVVENKVEEPTCVADGKSTFTASVEGYEDAEGVKNNKEYTIAALGHKLGDAQSYKWVEDEEGNPVVEVYATCTVCNEKITETLVPEQEYVEDNEPTCTTSGKVRYFVNSNGINTSKEVDVEALGHTIEVHDYTPSTCIEKGWKKGSSDNLKEGEVRKYGQCSICGQYFRAVCDKATGEIIRSAKVEENVARLPLDTENGHDYKVTINWVELKDDQGNVIGYDEYKTNSATLECTREGCSSVNASSWGVPGTNIIKKPLKPEHEYGVDEKENPINDCLVMELEGNCTTGATAKYTATVELGNGETYSETKTVNVSGHRLSSNYRVTSKTETVNGEQKTIHQHAGLCMYCGEDMGELTNCVPTSFTADDITAEGHKGTCACGYVFTDVAKHTLVDSGRTGDIVVNGYVHNGKIMKCSVCGYETIEENHTMKSTDKGHYCEKCGTEETAEPHTYTEWTKENNTYSSTCDVCGHTATENFYKVLETIPEWANNGAGYVTITFKSSTTCTLNNDIKEIPEGLRLVFESGSTLKVNSKVDVKGVVIIETGATCTLENGATLTTNKTVNGARVEGKVSGSGKLTEEVSTPKAFTDALNSDSELEVTVKDGVNVVYPSEKSSLGQKLTINLGKGSTMKVTGTLPSNNLVLKGEGAVELANATPTDNGDNLLKVVNVKASNIKLDTDAALDNSEKLAISENTALDLNNHKVSSSTQERVVEVSSGKIATIKNGTIETKSGSDPDIATLKTEGKLELNNVKVDTKGYGVFVSGESGSLTINGGEFISSDRPCIGTNNLHVGCKIEVKNAKLTTNSENEPAVFLPAKGEATFVNCTIKGGTAIEAVGLTTLNLQGTTSLEATRNTYNAPTLLSGEEASGSPILVVSRNGYSDNQKMIIKVGENVTFKAAASGNEIGDIEVKNKDANKGINKVEIRYSCKAIETTGDQNGNGLEVTTKQFSEELLWKLI